MKALITGVTGQDGWYLTELLKSKGYEVHGLVRRTSTRNADVLEKLDKIISGSVENYSSIVNIFTQNKYDEVYHLAAQSFVTESFIDPFTTADINFQGTLNILEAIRLHSPESRLYFAATSEMFGNEPGPQSECTPFMPRSPYGVSKLASYQMVKVYREAYGLYACSGILFNHESPRRGAEFVTQKIVKAVCKRQPLRLGNLEARRDWGHAKDYVRAMWLMLQIGVAEDFVIGTGFTHSVAEFLYTVGDVIGTQPVYEIDPKYYRPAEVYALRADSSKARLQLGWYPTISFRCLVEDMVKEELAR